MFTWDRPYYAPGEIVIGEAPFSWPRRANREIGGPEEAPYYAHLRPQRSNFRIPAAQDPDAIRVAIVEIETGRHRAGTARLEFLVPDVEGGHWIVQLCDASCTRSPGDLLATPIRIVATDAEERDLISSRLDALDRGISRARAVSLRTKLRLKRDLRRLDAHLRRAMVQTSGDMLELERRLDMLEKQESQSDQISAGTVGAVGALTGGGLSIGGATWWRRRRRSAARRPSHMFLPGRD